ncbi:MAG: hypothetical protein QW292_09110 [Candidatus Parvarchaeota archaeon]
MNENKNETNPFIKEFYERHGDIVPVDMADIINKERIAKRFIDFIKWVVTEVTQKNKAVISFWDKEEEIAYYHLYPDFQIQFDDNAWEINGQSFDGEYTFSIPYDNVDTIYVGVVGEFKEGD